MDSLPSHLSPRKSSAASDASVSSGGGLTFRGRSTPRGSNASGHDMETSFGAGGAGPMSPSGGLPSPSRYGSFGDGGANGGGGSSLNPEVRAGVRALQSFIVRL